MNTTTKRGPRAAASYRANRPRPSKFHRHALRQQRSATRPVIARNATIRRMALAIISLTDEHGSCTEAALIRQDFAATEVADLHEAACERTGEMCQGVQFMVVREDVA